MMARRTQAVTMRMAASAGVGGADVGVAAVDAKATSIAQTGRQTFRASANSQQSMMAPMVTTKIRAMRQL